MSEKRKNGATKKIKNIKSYYKKIQTGMQPCLYLFSEKGIDKTTYLVYYTPMTLIHVKGGNIWNTIHHSQSICR